MNGEFTSLQQQIEETIEDAQQELAATEFLFFLGWLAGRVVGEKQTVEALAYQEDQQ